MFEAKEWAEAQTSSQFRILLRVDASTDGITKPVARAKTRQGILPTMIEIARERAGTRPIGASIVHAAVSKQAGQLSDTAASEFSAVELHESEASPFPAVHNGRELVTFGFYADE